jgi:drug/metabolite transporter (DMT)-like permease
MGILFGLTAALCWGIADFVVTRVARAIGVLHAFFYVQCLCMLATAAVLLARPGAPAPSAGTWALAIVISLINLVGSLLLYRSFTIGTLALVSPIASAFGVVTALLALATGERPAAGALAGAALLIAGVIVVTRSHQGDGTGGHAGPSGQGGSHLRGVPEAIGVMFCFGVAFWALDYVTPALGVLWPVLAIRLIETVGALLWLLYRRTPPARLSGATWGLVIGVALLDTLAFVAFNLGLGTAYTSIVTALASLFSAVTILLAWGLLRERLAPGQWVGVGVILAGVLLVSL